MDEKRSSETRPLLLPGCSAMPNMCCSFEMLDRSLASVNLKRRGAVAAFGGVIVLGSGVKERLWASSVPVEKG